MSFHNVSDTNEVFQIKTVQQLLGDPESATVMMKPTIDMLQKATRTCAKLAMEVSERYQKWLGAACEVHAACCQTTTDVAYKQRANVVHLAATETQLKTGQTIVDAARGSVETLKTSLQHANEQFKRAADEFPSEWFPPSFLVDDANRYARWVGLYRVRTCQ